MSVKIRLQRKGRKKLPFYYIVVADSRSPRDGRFIERIGSYNPLPKFPEIDIDLEKAINWLDKGAQPTKTVRSIMSQKGILFKKHLNRGVKMGVITQEIADQKFAAYLEEKAQKLSSQLSKFKESLDKSAKLTLERESKVNELKAKKVMEKRMASAKAKSPKEEVSEEEVLEENLPEKEITNDAETGEVTENKE